MKNLHESIKENNLNYLKFYNLNKSQIETDIFIKKFLNGNKKKNYNNKSISHNLSTSDIYKYEQYKPKFFNKITNRKSIEEFLKNSPSQKFNNFKNSFIYNGKISNNKNHIKFQNKFNDNKITLKKYPKNLNFSKLLYFE